VTFDPVVHDTSHVEPSVGHMFSVEAMVCMHTFSLPTHVLAEETLEDGIFSLNSPFGSGRAVYL